MEICTVADWLDSFFYTYDFHILNTLHEFSLATNGIFTPFLKFISLLAENGIGMIALGVILILFSQTRKTGITVLLALAFGALITNLVLKQMIARSRPYADEISIFYTWWVEIKGPLMSDLSFPSGHVTATMAAMTSIFLSGNRKYSWTAFLFVILMGISRVYLMVHYPSDILGGIIAGGIGAILAYYVIKALYQSRERQKNE